ncbi:MAG: WG repeat-containing protein [Cyanobacteria bacterium REEB67]|nr:WG repeat-containing protein [Cyanobacteria bacterium REEB67]
MQKNEAAQNNASSDLLVVNEESLNPDFSLKVHCAIYERSGDEYRSSIRAIPADTVERIVKIALESRECPRPDLEEYGISQASVAQNLDLIAAEASNGRYQTFADVPAELQTLMDYDTIAAHAEEKILTRLESSDGNSSNTITIVDAEGKKLTISSKHEYCLRLPWAVSDSAQTWLCYRRELSRLLADLVSEESARLLRQNISWHYNENYSIAADELEDLGFFKHYGRSIRHHFESHQLKQDLRALPGYDEACEVFDVGSASGLLVPNMLVRDGEYRLEQQPYLRLKTLRSEEISVSAPAQTPVIDLVGWGCDGSWTTLLAKYKVLEEAARATAWLAQWKAAEADRSIFVEVLKDDQESWFDDESLEAIWDKYELSTKPDFHFYLRQGERCFYDVFVGFPYETAIVTTIEHQQGEGLEIVLDKIAVKTPSFAPGSAADQADSQFFIPQPKIRSRPYAVVSNNGTVEIINLPANKNAMRVVGHPSDESTVLRDDDRREDPYTWDEVEDLRNRNNYASPLAVQSDQVLFGLVGRDGLIVLSPQYDYIERFSEGLAKIRDQEGKIGFIDTRGNLVIKPQYERARSFRNGLAVVQKDGKWGYVDTRGNTVIDFQFESAHPFYEGVAAVKQGYRYGYVDGSGQFVIEPRFSRARRFVDGLALVQIDGKRGYIDHSGKLIGGCLYDQLGVFWEGMAAFNQEGKWGYIDTTGAEIIPARFTHANPFRDGTAMVRLEQTAPQVESTTASDGQQKNSYIANFIECFIDKSGAVIETPKTLGGSRMELHANVLRTRDKALRRFARAQGDANFNLVTVHASAGWFKEGLCPVEYQGKWGAINTNGTLVLPAKFDELGGREREWFTEGLIPACEGGKWGAIDITGTYIFRTDFEQIGLFYKGFAAVRQGSKYGFINNKGEVVVAPQFDTVSGFDKHGLAHVGLLKETTSAPFPARFV